MQKLGRFRSVGLSHGTEGPQCRVRFPARANHKGGGYEDAVLAIQKYRGGEYCDNCFSILLDDLEIADAELKRLQRNFQRATGRRWVPGGGYRLKRRGYERLPTRNEIRKKVLTLKRTLRLSGGGIRLTVTHDQVHN